MLCIFIVLNGVDIVSSSQVTKVFADRIGDLISESGLRIHDLSKKIGKSAGALSNYQNDSAEAGIDALYKIAVYFGVSSDYLIGLSDFALSNEDTRFIRKKTGLSEHTVSRLMQDDKRDKWAEVIDQLILHPGILDALHAYLFFDVDYFATVEDGKASDDHKKVMVLGDSAQKKVVQVYPRMMDGALQLEVQRELSDIKQQLKKRRRENAKEEG